MAQFKCHFRHSIVLVAFLERLLRKDEESDGVMKTHDLHVSEDMQLYAEALLGALDRPSSVKDKDVAIKQEFNRKYDGHTWDCCIGSSMQPLRFLAFANERCIDLVVALFHSVPGHYVIVTADNFRDLLITA